MDDAKLERLLGVFDRRSWEINRDYLIKAAKHLKDIGQLPPSDIHRIAEMRRMNTSMREIRRGIAEALGADEADVDAVLAQVAKENDWAARTMLAYGGEKVPLKENEGLIRLLEATSRATHESFSNLSNTTIDDSAYRHSIDRAIHAITTGVSDYGSEIRRCVRELAENGLRVKYPSGRTMRLDSAVRMNVLDGARHVNAESMRILGEGYGADGVEIDAHMLCAEDHLPYQGMQYTLEEFDDIQNGLMRPFGEWNCRHNIHYIVLDVSPRNYTDEELAEMKQFSTEQIEIDGVTKSRYEWSQTMRRLETKARYQNDATEALKAIGDKSGARMSDERSKMIVDAYDKVCQGAGLQPQYNRMYVGKAITYITDAERFKTATFVSGAILKAHAEKHLNQYGNVSINEYIEIARKLLQSEPSDDIMALTRSDASISKYRISTNDFVVGTWDGKIKTLFKPETGMDYWNYELERNK